DSNSFEKTPEISIDHAVMEKSERVAMVPAHMGWSDVGSWDTLWAISNQDDHGNVMLGDVITEQVQGSYIRSENKCVAALGLKNVIVVSTDDAVLVAGKEHAQQVKSLVEKLNARDSKPKNSRSKIHRPWGWYQSLEFGEKFQVKLINLSPGAKISLQRHQHRAEHWVVVAGIATVTREDQVLELRENQSTFISAGEIHRLENNADVPLQVIEVQSGEYLGEDDIERLDDQYGRV
ncbi:MAG: cupin domain-containing protein, partial [Rhodospirillales bacterium]